MNNKNDYNTKNNIDKHDEDDKQMMIITIFNVYKYSPNTNPHLIHSDKMCD